MNDRVTLPPLTVIEASAGTGKTFSLVTRLLTLIFAGTPPERIVALTFSRLAAGEIFNSFIERLAHAAASESVAAEESVRLGRTLAKADFAAKLREVIARQHLSLIGTLDSFLMRIVRMIPLELGLEGEVTVMSDYRTPVERMRLVGDMLLRETEGAKSIFREAFRLAFGAPGAKSFLEGFSSFIEKWHTRYRDGVERGESPWGDAARIWGDAAPRDLGVSLGEIRALADDLVPYVGKRGADTFIAAVREFGGTMPKTLPKCLAEEAVALTAWRRMQAWKIAHALQSTRGIFILMSAYEAAYAAKVRARGLVTFDDLPRLLNALPKGVRLPLEYRMDAQFDHWALDEFQDTSRGQWRALENLIDESCQARGEKSVFIVGDRKQSIYEWRGGDVEILGEQVRRAQEAGNRLVPMDESRRYVSVISEAVNRVFGEDVVRGAFDMDTAPEGAKWKCRRHESHDAATRGFVEVVQAKKAKSQPVVSDFFEPIANALKAVRPWERGIQTAILVRKNSAGEAILAYLKSEGIDRVVFEGDSNVSDSPVLAAMAELVRLAEHADDAFAHAHIACSPLATALYPSGLPEPAALSAQLLEDFTRQGLVRKFRAVREALKAVPESWNDFTESRFEDFIKCAAEFEETRDATMRLGDFIQFLEHKTRRDFAEPGMVRIMTMHQSKGLGFDWVILPLYEPEKLIGERHVGPLEGGAPNRWTLVNPGTEIDLSDPVLGAAERARQQVQIYNALCLDYVAMTRAKRALTLILNPENAKRPPSPERFSDLVRLVGLETCGDPSWYETFGKGEGAAAGLAASVSAEPAPTRPTRRVLRKKRPSESFYSGLRGDELFNPTFGKAAARGTDAHAEYAKIEWIDPDGARLPATAELERKILACDFRAAFVKPAPEATVWRERGYEFFLPQPQASTPGLPPSSSTWETGQFDRVVFTGAAGSRSAVIYDFKTNAPRAGETDAVFAARMKSTYASQMSAYRQALHRLTKIPLGRIETRLLLEATGQAVPV